MSILTNSRLPDPQRRVQGKINQQRGSNVEDIVKHHLKAVGFNMPEKIEPGFKPKYNTQGRVVGGDYLTQASGDFRALYGAGLSCLVEVKYRKKDKFSLSDLEPHQRQALMHHNDYGGISLVTWVTSSLDIYFMRWPIAILAHRRPIDQGEASALDVLTRTTLPDADGTPWKIDLYGINGTL